MLTKLDYNVIVVAYRGYSYSEGSPTERGLQMDAEAMLEFLKNPEGPIG